VLIGVFNYPLDFFGVLWISNITWASRLDEAMVLGILFEGIRVIRDIFGTHDAYQFLFYTHVYSPIETWE
jgi:hypothetical protein